MLQAIKWLQLWIFMVLIPSMDGMRTDISEMCVCRNLLLYDRVLTAKGDADSCTEKCRRLAEYIENPSTREEGQSNVARCINDGKEYNAGTVWRKKCDELSCNSDGKVTVKSIKCQRLCVSKKDEISDCCPLCKRTITCNSKEMILEIPRPMLRAKDLGKLTLSDHKCKPMINETHVTFRSKLESCGTKFRKARKGLVFTNTVQKSYSFIARPLFKFSCLFKVRNFDVDSKLAPRFKVKLPKPFTINMVYTDMDGKALKENPTNKQVMEGKGVYVQIRVYEKLKSHQFLVVERCSIVSLNRRKRYSLLENGCPVDSTFRILTKKPDIIWFSFQAKVIADKGSLYNEWFQFKNSRFHPRDREYVDLSCQAAVCSTESVRSICNRECKT